jgi:hypothetical protein
MLAAIGAVGCLLLLVDVKGRERLGDVIASELEKRMAVLARDEDNGLYTCTRWRRPLRSVGSSGAVIAMARTRRAKRNAVLVRIVAKHKGLAQESLSTAYLVTAQGGLAGLRYQSMIT